MNSGPGSHIAYKWLIFSVTAIGVFMSTLDGGIINVALPVMAKAGRYASPT